MTLKAACCSQQAVVLIGIRWVLYKLKRWHYYLLGVSSCSAKGCGRLRKIHEQLHFDFGSSKFMTRGAYPAADFCYFANIVLLIQLWLLPKSALLHKVHTTFPRCALLTEGLPSCDAAAVALCPSLQAASVPVHHGHRV